jgi:hypothetical protein
VNVDSCLFERRRGSPSDADDVAILSQLKSVYPDSFTVRLSSAPAKVLSTPTRLHIQPLFVGALSGLLLGVSAASRRSENALLMLIGWTWFERSFISMGRSMLIVLPATVLGLLANVALGCVTIRQTFELASAHRMSLATIELGVLAGATSWLVALIAIVIPARSPLVALRDA